MKITFYGAAQNVTGSKHLIELADGYKILLDCGLHQGKRSQAEQLNRQFPLDAKTINAAVLSHSHLDHCGMLPVLVNNGFSGKIYCTRATADIAQYMLMDSAKIQEQDISYINRHLRPGEEAVEPLYTSRDVEKVLPLFSPEEYDITNGNPINLSPAAHLSFYDAGHILGSAISYFSFKENGEQKTLAFTGDLGQGGAPLLREPQIIDKPIDTLIIEATYGSRVHAPLEDASKKLIGIVKRAIAKKSKILVPAFSLGRTQEIVYLLHKLTDGDQLPRIPIYVDSPLSNKITEAFSRHTEDFNLEVYNDFNQPGEDPLSFRNLHYITEVEDSKAINSLPGPLMIISASGMMESGRIRHHLAHNIENPDTTIVITGYQAVDTLGRKIHHGAKQVRILDQYYNVRAQVETINEFSAHADRNKLLSYTLSLNGLKRIFLVHAETNEAESFKELLNQHLPDVEVHIPAHGEQIDI